jgi:hypothetical protein
MVFGMMLVCKFYSRGAVRSGVTEGLTEAAAVRERNNLRETGARRQREERQANIPPVRLADMGKVFGRDVLLAIRQILRALVPEDVIPPNGHVVEPYRPVAAVQGFLAEDETQAFIAGVQPFFDPIPPKTAGRAFPGSARCRIGLTCWTPQPRKSRVRSRTTSRIRSPAGSRTCSTPSPGTTRRCSTRCTSGSARNDPRRTGRC